MNHVFVVGSKGIPAQYGGFETFIEELTAGKQSPEIMYHVSCMNNDENHFEYNDADCFNVRVPMPGAPGRIFHVGRVLSQVEEWIKCHSNERVIVYILGCRIGPLLIPYAKKLHKLGAKIYCNPDGLEWKRSKWSTPAKTFLKYCEKCLVENSDLSICDSVNIEKYIQETYSRVKIIYVGNLVEDRFILKALSLADSIPNVEFHIGGMGALEDVVARIAQEKENVFFYGKMKYSDVISLENQGDILLALYDPALPNHRYAAPNKFYEALALGKPLIMFHNTGMDDIVMANNIGAVCDATEKGIYSAIIELQSKRDVWAPMAEKMKALFDEEYSWNIMEKRLMSLYEEIVGS